MRSVLVWCSVLFVLLGVTNFASFLCITQLAGGGADHIANGHYFLWTRLAPDPGGRITEVSQFTYLWVLWQERSVFIMLPFELLAAGFLFREQKKRSGPGQMTLDKPRDAGEQEKR